MKYNNKMTLSENLSMIGAAVNQLPGGTWFVYYGTNPPKPFTDEQDVLEFCKGLFDA